MSIAKIIFDGRFIKDPEQRSYGEKTLCSFTVASDVGWGDSKRTLFFNCTAFGKTGEAIMKFFHKGDGIFITGTPTQNKKDDKVYHGVVVNEWSFGPKKLSGEQTYGTESPVSDDVNDSPFDDTEIPF